MGILSWSAVREADGVVPTTDRVAEWWKESRRTAFREQDAFRKAFPTLQTPETIYEIDGVQQFAQAVVLLDAAVSDGKDAREGRAFETALLEVGMFPRRCSGAPPHVVEAVIVSRGIPAITLLAPHNSSTYNLNATA
jgi:hypothetical protein